MKAIMIGFWDHIIFSLESERSALSKNALIFTQELFSNSSTSTDLQIEFDTLMKVLPIILNRSLSEKNFLRTEAAKTIHILSNECLYDSAIIAFCRECLHKNPRIGEIATDSVCKQITSIGQNLPKCKTATFTEALVTLGKVVHSGKRAKMNQEAKKTIAFMYQIVGKESYQNYVDVCISTGLDEKTISSLTSVYKVKKQEVQRKTLKEIMAEKKKAAMEINNNGIENELDLY